jgi:hypothetical protein
MLGLESPRKTGHEDEEDIQARYIRRIIRLRGGEPE